MTDKKLIFVCLHGVGKQRRGATARVVANQLASLYAGGETHKLPQQPLGYFHNSEKEKSRASPLNDGSSEAAEKNINVAEVFWADIPQSLVQEGRTLEDIKSWGRTVVEREEARLRIKRKRKHRDEDSDSVIPNFMVSSEAVGAIVDTVDVLEGILSAASLIGLPKLPLRATLEEYLGDVQVIAEFEEYRNQVVKRFCDKMSELLETCDCADPEFHIIAHSEGSVVSFLGMLRAMKCSYENDVDTRFFASHDDATWIRHVRSYMTIGSPIDKHLKFWPKLFKELDLENTYEHCRNEANAGRPLAPIRWNNYSDGGDPIGSRLKETRAWLDNFDTDQNCSDKHKPIIFREKDDHEFNRYSLPGKAHNDYWNDESLFEHYKETCVEENKVNSPRPALPDQWRGKIALCLPFGLSLLFFIAAVASFYYPVRTILGRLPANELPWTVYVVCRSIGLTALLVGLTLAARLPRLLEVWGVFGKKWTILIGVLVFSLGSATYCLLVDELFQRNFGFIWPEGWWPRSLAEGFPPSTTVSVLIAAGLISLVGYFTTAGKNVFRHGMWPLIIGGFTVVVSIVLNHITTKEIKFDYKGHSGPIQIIKVTNDESSVQNGVISEPWIPGLLFGTVFFFYFWRLAGLVFDLSFFWYIYRRSNRLQSKRS